MKGDRMSPGRRATFTTALAGFVVTGVFCSALFVLPGAAIAQGPPSALGGERRVEPDADPAPVPNVPWRGRGAAAPKAMTNPALGTLATAASPGPKGLFDLPDATPIVVSGRATTAGDAKRLIAARIAAKAGPPRTVQARPRRLETIGVTQTPVRAGWEGTAGRGDAGRLAAPASTAIVGPAPSAFTRPVDRAKTEALAGVLCGDDGPPSIVAIDGVLTPGGTAAVRGSCFGDRAGRVEAIGDFPGGRLVVAFTGWTRSTIVVQVAADVRGTPDGIVALTVVGADGRRSPAAEVRFVARRETVEVPSRLWSPASSFALSATTDATPQLISPKLPTNAAAAGTLVRALRIDARCELATMSVDVVAGDVTAIRGFETGPPNEATASIDWTGTCIDTTTTTINNYLWDQSKSATIRMACSVALSPRAWASCPAGLSP